MRSGSGAAACKSRLTSPSRHLAAVTPSAPSQKHGPLSWYQHTIPQYRASRSKAIGLQLGSYMTHATTPRPGTNTAHGQYRALLSTKGGTSVQSPKCSTSQSFHRCDARPEDAHCTSTPVLANISTTSLSTIQYRKTWHTPGSVLRMLAEYNKCIVAQYRGYPIGTGQSSTEKGP